MERPGEDRLFYPDWIVKFKNGRIGIFDTKGGMTAEHTEGRETGLRNKIAAMNTAAGGNVFFGGIVVKENGQWYCHVGPEYSYRQGNPGPGWILLESVFAQQNNALFIYEGLDAATPDEIGGDDGEMQI